MPRYGARPQLITLLIACALLLPATVVPNCPVGGMFMVSSQASRTVFRFPHGGRRLFPTYRLVALYGAPGIPALGALGEQDAPAAAKRAQQLARDYQLFLPAGEYAMPAFEITATIAASEPTSNGDYTYALDQHLLGQWIDSAQQHGIYVVLDVQPGRSDFLTQAQQLQPLLLRPNVGLALDPEWRLGPSELPLEQIGSADAGEMNQAAAWLAALVRTHHLPQKLLVLHQFRLDMIRNRNALDTSHTELAVVIQMDGQGSQGDKLRTWQAITAQPPAGVRFGWKNFYTKDQPLRSPAATLQLAPQPWYISYQ